MKTMRDEKPIPRKYNPNELKHAKKVINGKAKVRKKSEASKLASSLVSSDASSVKSYIFSDVIIPAAKKLIYDIFTDGIDMILYGGRSHDGRRPVADRIRYTQYDKISDNRSSFPSQSTFKGSSKDTSVLILLVLLIYMSISFSMHLEA